MSSRRQAGDEALTVLWMRAGISEAASSSGGSPGPQRSRPAAFPGRLGDPAGEVVEAGIVGIEVVRMVVVEEELP